MIKNDLNNIAEKENYVNKGDFLPLMESFYTIQGEGAFTGHPAWFIRLGGCDVGCIWCDVKESWDADKHPVYSIKSIVEQASSQPSSIAVITGGEPLMYNLDLLTKSLHKSNFRNHIETSGVYPVTGEWDWICFSPKKFKSPNPVIYSYVNELKVIIYSKSDFAFAEKYFNELKKVNKDFRAFLQPEWSKADKMLPKIIQYVKENPVWQISLQTHKYMEIP